MAGVLILWLVMKAVCQPLQEKRVALFSDNSPAVGWTKTPGFLQIACCQALCTGTGPLDQDQQNLLFNDAPRQRQTQLDLRCPFKVIWQHPGVALLIGQVFSNPVQLSVPPSAVELLDRLPAELKSTYARDFHASDAAFQSGKVAQTTKKWESLWDSWCTYVQPLGVDPYLQTTPFGLHCRCLMGYTARVRSGYFGKGKQVQASTVTSAITAVGKKITMDTNTNPTKLVGSKQFIMCIQELLDGYRIADPPTEKKLPIEADVPELLFELGYGPSGTTLGKAVGDLTLIAFYYLLRVGKYTVKGTRNKSKQTVQFKLEDVTFFHRNDIGQLGCLPQDAPLEMLLSAEGACLKLDNQKNGWKGVCVYQQHNGDPLQCPIGALAWHVTHMRSNNAVPRDYLSLYYVNGARKDVTADDIGKHLKLSTRPLNFPMRKGILVERVDTHSLRGGSASANALALSGYSETEIQK